MVRDKMLVEKMVGRHMVVDKMVVEKMVGKQNGR